MTVFLLVATLVFTPACDGDGSATSGARKRTLADKRARLRQARKRIRKVFRKHPKPTNRTRTQPRTTYRAELKYLDDRVAFELRRTKKKPQHPAPWRGLSSAYLQRAKLTGSYADYGRADKALAQAFAVSSPVSAPLMQRMRLNYTLHRLPAVEADLRRYRRTRRIHKKHIQAELLEIEGDLAVQRGQYAKALSLYRKAQKIDRAAPGQFRIALYYWKTGDHEAAERYIDSAERLYRERSPQVHAWYELQRGLLDLDRGRWADALAHYTTARNRFSGWWLIQEHVAEILALQGKLTEALTAYQDLVRRTKNPELMDALAEVYTKLKQPAQAKKWVAEARKTFDARLAEYREAAFGHALEHYLEHDPPRALELARKNATLRPGGEAQVMLAQALLKNGKAGDAKAVIDRVLATPYRHADLFAAAYAIYRALKLGPQAEGHKKRALAINPHALD